MFFHFSKMTSLIKFAFRHRNIVNYTECKRFAGHSKWANIRHTKMAKDQEKCTALMNYTKQMKIAIAEGKSAVPENNMKLARVIEQAKKNSMPMATIKNFLEKMQKTKVSTQSVIVESRGPSGVVVLVHLLTDKPTVTRNSLNTHLRKTNFAPNEIPSQGMYEQKGIIFAKVDDRDIEKNTEDAIEAGAEEVEKVIEDDKELLQFTSHASEMLKVRNKLEALNYKIIQAEVEFIPKVFTTLNDEEMESVSKLYDKLEKMEEVVKIYTNIS